MKRQALLVILVAGVTHGAHSTQAHAGTFAVAGAVYTDSQYPMSSGLHGVAISVAGDGNEFRTVTDTLGIWLIEDVPSGAYTVTPVYPGRCFEHVVDGVLEGGPPLSIMVDAVHQAGNLSIQFLAKAGAACRTCGDGRCDPGEDSASCPEDCYCGNGTCEFDEDSCDCSQDCGSECGDGCCNANEDPCSCPDDCLGECPSCAVVSSMPPSCAIDSRYPHAADDPADRYGWDAVEMTFDCDVASLDGDGFFLRTEPAIESSPTITGVARVGDTIVLTLSDPIPPGAWTCIAHSRLERQVCLGFLPADGNGDGAALPSDILYVIDNLNGVLDVPLLQRQCDVDRSGSCGTADILAIIDLLNGAASFMVWNGETLGACPDSP